MSAIMRALGTNNLEKVKECLLANPAEVNECGRGGMTPLIWAAGYFPKAVPELLKRGALPTHCSTSTHGTALGAAASNGHGVAVKSLLAYRADPNQVDMQKFTALMRAVIQATPKPRVAAEGVDLGHIAPEVMKEIITDLIEARADPGFTRNSARTVIDIAREGAPDLANLLQRLQFDQTKNELIKVATEFFTTAAFASAPEA